MSHPLPPLWRWRARGLVLTVPVLLYLIPIHRLVRWLGTPRDGYRNPPTDALVRAVDYWLRRLPWPWRITCLKRAAVLFGLLRRSGIAVSLHIGVARSADGALAAHAWLVRDGAPYLEPPASDVGGYRVISTFPESVPAS